MSTLIVNKTYTDGQILGELNLDNAFNSITEWVNNGGIGADNIQDNSITPAELQTSSITTSKIAPNAVTTPKIADGSVTLAKLALELRDYLTPVGKVTAYGGDTAPAGYLLCDGGAYSRTLYSALFAVYGERFGSGDGSTTFNVPDMRGRMIRGATLGATQDSVTGSGTAGSNQATFTAHKFMTGTQVRLLSGTLAGLSPGVDYYAIRVSANSVAFATSYANAMANIRIVITGSNTAVIASLRDPEAAARTAMNPGGATGDAVGSVQQDDMKYKDLVLPLSVSSGTNRSVVFTSSNVPSTTDAALLSTDSSKTGLETRSKNAYFNFIVKF